MIAALRPLSLLILAGLALLAGFRALDSAPDAPPLRIAPSAAWGQEAVELELYYHGTKDRIHDGDGCLAGTPIWMNIPLKNVKDDAWHTETVDRVWVTIRDDSGGEAILEAAPHTKEPLTYYIKRWQFPIDKVNYSFTFTAHAMITATPRNQKKKPATKTIDSGPLTVTTTLLEVSRVVFTSDHGVLIDQNASFAAEGGRVFDPRGWVLCGDNNPVTHSCTGALAPAGQGQRVTIEVTLRADPRLTKDRATIVCSNLIGDADGEVLDFTVPSITLENGQPATATVTAAGPLPKGIQELAPRIRWRVTIDRVSTWGYGLGEVPLNGSGPHRMLLTLGPPQGSAPTLKRVAWAVATTGGHTPEVAANGLQAAIARISTFHKSGNRVGWPILDNPRLAAASLGQATLLKQAVEILGGGPATLHELHATTDADCSTLETRDIGGRKAELWLDFDLGPTHNDLRAGHWICEVGNWHRSVTPNAKVHGGLAVLHAIGVQQYWVLPKNPLDGRPQLVPPPTPIPLPVQP